MLTVNKVSWSIPERSAVLPEHHLQVFWDISLSKIGSVQKDGEDMDGSNFRRGQICNINYSDSIFCGENASLAVGGDG